METANTRFKGSDWFDISYTSCIVGGCGGIGSWLTLFLKRANFSPIVYDFDYVEEHNLGGQLFGHEHIKSPKVEAINNVVRQFCSRSINTFQEDISNAIEMPFCFSAFDNMEARKEMFKIWKKTFKYSDSDPILIDGRLNMEYFQIFSVTKKTMNLYEKKYLFEDNEVIKQSCTQQQTTHVAAMIASYMVAIFTNHISNIKKEENYRKVPFLYENFIPSMFSKIHERCSL